MPNVFAAISSRRAFCRLSFADMPFFAIVFGIFFDAAALLAIIFAMRRAALAPPPPY